MSRQFRPQRIDNLFDVRCALVDVNDWLVDHWEPMKDAINLVLMDLLALKANSLRVEGRDVWITVKEREGEVRIKELSSGDAPFRGQAISNRLS